MALGYPCLLILFAPLFVVSQLVPKVDIVQDPTIGKAINETVRLFTKLPTEFISSKTEDGDPRIKRGISDSFYEYLVKLGLNKICRLLRLDNIEEVLSPLGSFTLFAPTDEAFALLPGSVLEQIESNPVKLREFLTYHITRGQIPSNHMQNDVTVPSITGRPIRFNIYITDKGKILSVSGGLIISADNAFDSNIIHVLDRVLYPSPSMDIVTVVKWTHDSLYRLIVSSGIERTLSDGIYTFFAPSDDAFKGLPQTTREIIQKNTTLLRSILLNHIIPGSIFTTGLYDGLVLTSVGGATLTFTFRRGLILVNGIPLVEPDVSAINGVIHVINRVLVPKEILADCQCLPERKEPEHRPTDSGEYDHHITIIDHHGPAPKRTEDQPQVDDQRYLELPSDSRPKKPSSPSHHDTIYVSDHYPKPHHKTELPFGQRKPTTPTKPYKPYPDRPHHEVPIHFPLAPSVHTSSIDSPPWHHRSPTSETEASKHQPKIPGERPGRPTYQPSKQEERPTGRPTYQPSRPEERPARPTFQPKRPEERPERPTFQPKRPEERPERPTFQPKRPEERPERPTYQPSRPEERPERPTYQPQRPDKRPFVPSVHPTLVPSRKPHPSSRKPHPSSRKPFPSSRRPFQPSVRPSHFPSRFPSSPPHISQPTEQRPSAPKPEPYPSRRPSPSITPAHGHHIDIIHHSTRPIDVPKPSRRPTTTTTIQPERQVTIVDVFEKPSLIFEGHPISFQIIYTLFKEVSLIQHLVQPGPTAVFVPPDDILTQLPEGTLKELRHNPDLLHQILLYHVITVPPPPFNGPSIQSVRTSQGLPALIRYDEHGRITEINGVDVITARGIDSDHVIYVITRLLHPLPKPSINAYLSSRRDIYRFFTYLVKSSLDEVIKGPELFTLFLPTDEAFNEIPRYQLDQILNNRTVLEEFLLNHVVPGIYFSRDLQRSKVIPALRGERLSFKTSPGGRIEVNDATFVESDICTGNGVIHVIDRLAYIPPYLSKPQIPSAPSISQDTIRIPSTHRPSQVPTTTFDLSRPGRPSYPSRPADDEHVVDHHHIIIDHHPRKEHRPTPSNARTRSPPTTTSSPGIGLKPDIDVTITEILQRPELVFANQQFSISTSYELFRDAGLIESLSSKGPFTIFIPTDEAFSALSREEFEGLRTNTENLRQILLYHMITATLPPTDTQTTYMVTTAGGKPILLTYDERGNIILVDGVEVVTSKVGSNGAIYVITKFLYPLPEKSIIHFIQGRQDLATTLEHLVATGIDKLLQGKEPFTFFAPSNDAFKQLSHEELHHLVHNKTSLERFLLNHVLGGIHFTKELQTGLILPTPRGSVLSFRTSGEGYVSVNGANVIEGDITTGTGVIHIIDSVIRTSPEVRTGDREPVESVIVVPPGEHRSPNIVDLLNGMGLAKFALWLTETNLLETVQDGNSYTIFIPTDEAISSLPGLGSVEKDPNQLRRIVQYHISPMYIQTGSIKNDDIIPTLLEGKEIRLNIYQNGQIYTASGAPFAPPSNPGNVLIAVVDRVLFPPQGDIFTTVSKLTVLKQLKASLEVAGLQDLLQSTGPFTLFAPSNEAFDNLHPDDRQKLLSNPQALLAALRRHIVQGKALYTSGVTEGLRIQSSTNEALTLSLKPNCVAVDGINVAYPDITAFNGVIHIIDHFL